jgi:rfaE bifunctional protein nucleotidyltransferase chain/domain
VPHVRVVTPNRDELRLVAGPLGRDHQVADAAERARAAWGAAMVAVTLGGGGAVLVGAGAIPLAVPVARVVDGDPCGAGDRFASAFAAALADGSVASDALARAVDAASAFVAAGSVQSLIDDGAPTAAHDARTLVARVRAAGGTIVATSGCFDLLHAGHVASLQAARALGDCLVVCLNSDESVRRIKGPGRPLQGQADRARVLASLEFVDAVVVFDGDTPHAPLEQLRPDVFVKGGDYGVEDLPETAVLAGWGGRTVTVPYLQGRSTTALVDEARRRGR